jgi:hypothetical protein
VVSYLGRLAAIAVGDYGDILNDTGLITDGERAPHTLGGWGNIFNDSGLITDGEKASIRRAIVALFSTTRGRWSVAGANVTVRMDGRQWSVGRMNGVIHPVQQEMCKSNDQKGRQDEWR